MKISYGSVAAFLAHYYVLRRSNTGDREGAALLKQMTEIVRSLGLDSAALESPESETKRTRHRERAERHLRRKLVELQILTG